MKSHLFRFFTWLCMKISVVSRRRFCYYFFYILYIHDFWRIKYINKLSTVCTLSPWWPKTTYFTFGWSGISIFLHKNELLGTLHFMVSEHVNATLHIVISWKYWHINFSLELLKSWLSAFWDPGHSSDGSIRTRLFWCCRAAAEFGSQSPHQGT